MTEQTKPESDEAPNEGTQAKQTLQIKALKFMQNYPTNQTLKAYAEYLCWDINVSARTALDSYIMPLLRRGYLKYVGNSPYSGKSLYTFINPLGINSVPSADSQIDYTLESKRKEQLTKLIEAELKTNPKLSESEAVQKFATKFVPEDLVSFCFDIAKNHVELERQKKETPTEYMKRRNKEKHEQGQPTALEEEKGEAKT